MTFESFRDVLWTLSLLLGWLSVAALGGAWYAKEKFRALLKAPLTDEVERLTHLWEHRVGFLMKAGLSMAVLSVLSLAAWLVTETLW
ncbi:hypothetical protein [Microvirga lenta]|uniref:hypothetical protein n=1 Tax=Microvirga lenta TaxID=2881337 RepID=UPI001CFF8069|nr:hypothetical protein [Microvirga lenta]MCB5175209.1 hypothetical protein [Microvirga lenta]